MEWKTPLVAFFTQKAVGSSDLKEKVSDKTCSMFQHVLFKKRTPWKKTFVEVLVSQVHKNSEILSYWSGIFAIHQKGAESSYKWGKGKWKVTVFRTKFKSLKS